MMSPSRGRNSENSAAAVKNAVWVRPMSAESALRSSSMVVSAGLSMLALSWKATQAASSAAISAPTLTRGPWLRAWRALTDSDLADPLQGVHDQVPEPLVVQLDRDLGGAVRPARVPGSRPRSCPSVSVPVSSMSTGAFRTVITSGSIT